MKDITKKQILITGAFLMVSILAVFLILRKESKKITPIDTNPAPTAPQRAPFRVLTTSPANGEVNVFSGEIQISFTTDQQVSTSKDFSLTVSPPTNYPLKLVSDFPTNTIIHQVLGGLKMETNYTVTVKNRKGDVLKEWSFKTSNVHPESSSKLLEEEQKQLNDKYYPLFDVVPYENSDFKIYYTGRLTFKVIVKSGDVESIKRKVDDWIKSKGIDPSTHTITYVNAF